jgi:hypothetical protein
VSRLFKRIPRELLAFLAAVSAFPFVLRGAISIFHPKEGEILLVLNAIGANETMHWVGGNISLPVYEILVRSVWQNASVFVVTWLLFAFALTAIAHFWSFKRART